MKTLRDGEDTTEATDSRTAATLESQLRQWTAEIHTAYSGVQGPRYFNGHYAEYAEASEARLIAAAPDLLAALKAVDSNLRAEMPNGPDGSVLLPETTRMWQQVLAAIVKAEGR